MGILFDTFNLERESFGSLEKDIIFLQKSVLTFAVYNNRFVL